MEDTSLHTISLNSQNNLKDNPLRGHVEIGVPRRSTAAAECSTRDNGSRDADPISNYMRLECWFVPEGTDYSSQSP